MNTLNVGWSDIKSFVDSRSLNIQWIIANGSYYLYAFDGPFSLSCQIHIASEFMGEEGPEQEEPSAEQTDFELHYKNSGNQPNKAIVTTQYELNNKDLKLAKTSAQVDPDTGRALFSLKVPGQFGSVDGRYIAGGYAITEDYDKDDYAMIWCTDDDRAIAWALALGMDPNASAPLSDETIQQMGVLPGGLSAFGALPSYPLIKNYFDDVSDEHKGWYFWPMAQGNNLPPAGETEVEPIAGFAFIPSGLYLKGAYVRPEGKTTGSIRVNFFWGQKDE